MRKFIIFLTVFVILIGCFPVSAAEDVSTSARAFVLTDEFGDIIFENNAHTRLPMASTTKIMTAIVALDHLDLGDIVSVPKEAVGVEGSSAYLKEGEKLTVNDLLNALLLQSANDAAISLAVAAKGSVRDFCAQMNEKAEKMGLVSTHFDNPHGLDSENHYTTAYELAIITAKAFEIPILADIMGAKKYSCTSHTGTQRTFVNHNRLPTLYEYCIGGKTGYTKADGRCLATAAENNGVRLIAVTLDAPNDWSDHQKLYNAGFDAYSEQKLCGAYEFEYSLDVVGSDIDSVKCINTAAVFAHVRNNCEITTAVELPDFEYAPVCEGQSVGRVVFLQNGNEIAYAELVAANEAKTEETKEKIGFWHKIINFFKNIFGAIFARK